LKGAESAGITTLDNGKPFVDVVRRTGNENNKKKDEL